MSRDLRKYSRQTKGRSLIGFILILLIVGDGIIYLIYGPAGAVSGLLCIGAGMAPLLIIWAAQYGIDWILKKINEQ